MGLVYWLVLARGSRQYRHVLVEDTDSVFKESGVESIADGRGSEVDLEVCG